MSTIRTPHCPIGSDDFKLIQWFFKYIHKLCQYLLKATHCRELFFADVVNDASTSIFALVTNNLKIIYILISEWFVVWNSPVFWVLIFCTLIDWIVFYAVSAIFQQYNSVSKSHNAPLVNYRLTMAYLQSCVSLLGWKAETWRHTVCLVPSLLLDKFVQRRNVWA